MRMMFTMMLVLSSLLSPTDLRAQAPAPAAQTASPTVAPEKFSEMEALRVENIKLHVQLAHADAEHADCVARLGPAEAQLNSAAINQKFDALRKDVEKAHPGYTIDPSGQLVKKS
jgi:hypothetical protein